MRRRRVHLVAARGGHLELLQCLRGAFEDYERIWVTEHNPRADALEAEGERVERLPYYGRNPLRLAANVRAAAAVIRETRPGIVVCSGSGLTVPFCALARAAGAKLVFTETMARITNASMTGRVLSRLADDVLVQWPDMARVYPGATVCRPALLETIGARPAGGGNGTFVAVGTWHQPFDRLLRMVDEAVRDGVLPGPVRAQTGVSTYRPDHYAAEPHLEPAALERQIEQAEVVVCHAGSGILASTLRVGKRPLVLPRLREHAEHVDDHQAQIAGKLDEYGLARILGDEIAAADLAAARAPLPAAFPASVGESLEEALAERLQLLAGRPVGELALAAA